MGKCRRGLLALQPRRRTAAEVRHIFAKNDGNLGTSGAVAWLFERKGVVIVAADSVDEDDLTDGAWCTS